MQNPKTMKAKKETIKSRTENPLYIGLSKGNKKLKDNERVSFLIWNIPAVITCPYRTVLCEHFCYALKAEIQYPDCKPCRMRHFEISKQADFAARMIYTIETELMRPKNKNKNVVFRIHESGDFYNKAYVEKWLVIMNHFSDVKNLVFVAYTKSVRFFDGLALPDNFKLLASVWNDTKQSNLDIIARNNYRIYTAYAGEDLKKAIENGFSKCGCADCAKCGKCWNDFTYHICCEIH